MAGPLVVAAFALAAQTALPAAAPPRDRAAAHGTAVIKGRVTAADSGLALHRALVSLSGGPQLTPNSSPTPGAGTVPARTRNISANTDGTFEFNGLPAGTYHLRVTPGPHRTHYLPMAFGGRGPLDVGKPIELGDGQTVQSNFALPRGGVIVGRVVDDFGEPVSRVRVFPLRVTAGGSFLTMGGEFNQTDDQGRFRLYGLQPAEYIVGTETRSEGDALADRSPEGFAITYFPSASAEREAGRVRVSAGQDSSGVEITLIRTRTFRITGTILDSQGRTLSHPSVMLVRSQQSGESFHSGSFDFDASGKFTLRGVAPGNYRVVVRPASVSSEASTQLKEPREFANVPLSVAGDIEDFVVVTQPAVTISGNVVFAEGAPSPLPSGMRIRAQFPENTFFAASPPTAPVGPDLQFTLTDLFGPYYIRLMGFPPGHVLKAVLLDATDITDTPVEFKPEDSRRLQLVLTGRTSILEGTVTDERGEPASEVSVLILPEDKTSWRFGSFRMRITTASDGKFRLEGILAGRYQVLAIARDRLRPSADVGAEVLEPFLKDAATVLVGENDKRTVALRVARGREP